MKSLFTLALFVVIGFIASKGLFSPPRFRLPATVLMLTGIEFFFLGVLLGPHFLGLITPQVLDDLTPVVYLALGWAGLLFGIQLSWQHIRRVRPGVFRFLALESLIVGLIAFGVLFGFLRARYPELALTELLTSSIVLALTALISSPTIVTVLARMLPSSGKFTNTMRVVSALSPVIPLFVFGGVFIVAHPGYFAVNGFFSGLAWWLFANAIGLVMGGVFWFLTVQKLPRDERLLLIMGTCLVVGGVCYFLKLSALYTSMVMGIFVGNVSTRRVQIFEQLLSIEKTLYIAFLIVIGAMVSLSGVDLVLIIVFYVLLRVLLKLFVSSILLRRCVPELGSPGTRSGLALTAQGGMALAVALDYGLGLDGVVDSAIVAVIAGAVVLNEFIGVYTTRAAYKASGEVRVRRADTGPTGGRGGANA